MWAALIALEIGLGAAVAAGVDAAAQAAALLMAGACVAQVGAIAAGRAGSPCACFGARGRVGQASAGRAAVLAAALALLPILPRGHVSAGGWLAIGLALALAGDAAAGDARHEPRGRACTRAAEVARDHAADRRRSGT